MGAGKKIGNGIRLAIMAACYFLAARCSENVQDAAQIVVVPLADGGVTAARAEAICEEEREEELSLCFWREQKGVQFSCEETGATVWATALLTEGAPELVARGSGFLAWQEEGCMTDAATAQELFGTQRANGQLVWCGGNAYTVYGTFESLERTVVLRTGGLAEVQTEGLSGAAAQFDHLSLKTPEGTSAKAGAEQLLMRCGLSGDVADFTFPGMICQNLLLVLPALLAAGLIRILWSCLRTGVRQRQSGTELAEIQNAAGRMTGLKGRFFCAAMLVGVAAAVFFLFRNHLQIPADMIPTRWSDFSFWTQWWTGQKANLLQILGSAQGEMHLEALWNCGLSVICDLLAIVMGLSFLHVDR